MIKVAIALALALVCQPVAAFAQPTSASALSPQELVVLSYFHDVLDGRQIGLLETMGIIFVPSVRGISHSPLEFTQWDDYARRADVLLGAVLDMDRA